MAIGKKIDYTLRGVPPETAARIRETAAAEGASVNATLLRLIDRGLEHSGALVRKRDLRSLVADLPKLTDADLEFWNEILAENRRIDPEIWR